jgi:poly(3-hydroxybutyrate) depolymerase
VTNQGSVVEATSGRTYFLDYPCDLKQGEKVTVILDFHGGGSYGNWQRNYFPLMDYVKKYRLIVAAPNSPGGGWPDKDNSYLENIVTSIIEQVGAKNIKSFWLVGHSMGGFKSRRLVCSDFFKSKVDGYLSLSGSRVGSPPADAPAQFNIPQQDDTIASAASARPPGPPAAAGRSLTVTPQGSLECDFSFIFSAGEHEPSIQSLPATSSWAEKYSCAARTQKKEVLDSSGGYVYDSSRQQYGNDSWGRLPHGGTAKILEYPKCKDGRIVADVIREGKGHTEGYEPHITEELIKMMLAAKGGKIHDGK